MGRRAAPKDIKFTRDATGHGTVIDRRGRQNFYWGGGTQAQPGGRNTSYRTTALHPFSPRLRASRQAQESQAAARARKTLGIYGPGASSRGGR